MTSYRRCRVLPFAGSEQLKLRWHSQRAIINGELTWRSAEMTGRSDIREDGHPVSLSMVILVWLYWIGLVADRHHDDCGAIKCRSFHPCLGASSGKRSKVIPQTLTVRLALPISGSGGCGKQQWRQVGSDQHHQLRYLDSDFALREYQ